MIFVEEWDWHIKNDQLSYLWLEFNFFLSKFRMPLLFFISGVGTWFALRERSYWQFIKERHNRLIIPLLFGMLVIVPPQIYFERLFEGQEFGSFLDFCQTVFEMKPYPAGNLSWHHLWFILYLFFYSVVAVPLIMFLRSCSGKKFLNGFIQNTGKYSIYLFSVTTLVVLLVLCSRYPEFLDGGIYSTVTGNQ